MTDWERDRQQWRTAINVIACIATGILAVGIALLAWRFL